MISRVIRFVPRLLLAFLFAYGLGLHVYPSHPFLVWGLLGFCWLAFRLQRRARRLFGTGHAGQPIG